MGWPSLSLPVYLSPFVHSTTHSYVVNSCDRSGFVFYKNVDQKSGLVVESLTFQVYTAKLGYNELGFNELGYNELGYNDKNVCSFG